MNRFKYKNRNYGNRNYNNYNKNNNYNNYNHDYRDRFPEIARLSYGYLDTISRRSKRSINPGVFNPYEKIRHFKINCYASFNCYKCGNFWTSNQVTVELWWNKGKKEFDVRIYGQQCKRCNREFIRPYISGIENIIEKCVEILTHSYNISKEFNANKNTNTQFNSSHDQKRCQKCQIINGPCWK